MVSVVMPVFNAEKYVDEAIQSILNQTYPDFEFIIIDDGSTDKSATIIESIKDDRIIILRNHTNKGLIYSLNRGIDYSRGKYIARMDADDVCEATRFAEQVQFMERHPAIGICGTAYRFFGIGKNSKTRYMNSNPFMNKANLMFYPVLAHPSVMMRKSVFDKYALRYNDEFKNAEDYGLWVEAIKYTDISNINKKLLNYRIVKNSVTRNANKDFNARFEIHKKIYKQYFEGLGINLTNKELMLHFIISDNERFRKYNFDYKEQIEEYLDNLEEKICKLPHSRYYCLALAKRKLILSVIKKEITKIVLQIFSYIYYKISISITKI